MEIDGTIIDTDILIDLLRNNSKAVELVQQIESEKSLLCTTTINVFELYYGAHKSIDVKQNVGATKKLLERLFILPLTARSARKAGRIYAELEKQGKMIGLRDTFIASIALTKGYKVTTRNTDHFKKIKGLNIITS